MMRSLLSLALLLAAPAVLSSQQAVPVGGRAVVTGIAVDSVRGGYLRGAIVSVSGTTLSAMTDSIGRFRVDSVPAGTRYLEVMHPLLDSIALTVRTPPRELKAGDTTAFILAVPSPSTIVAAKCTAEERARGAGALLGTVTDADSDAPSSGAIVTVEWTEYQLGRRSMARIPQRRAGVVRPDGSYRVCGIPDDLATGVLAHRGADSTGTVATNFERKLAIVSFKLPARSTSANTNAGSAPQASATQNTVAADSLAAGTPRGTATITGKVLDPSGAPLANARVAVEADNAAAITDNAGVFRLTGLRTGTRLLTVRRLGFASEDVPVDVSGTSTRSVSVTMSRYVAQLDAVRVTAIRDIGLQRVGFTERQKAHAGKFFGPEDLQRRNAPRLNYVLETAPMLRTGTNAEGKRYITGRQNGCVAYFVDGHSWFIGSNNDPDVSPDAFLSGSELGAIEVYDEMSAPAEYMRFSNRGAPCAVVVIWTRAKLGT
jgi:hypothetical protein